MGKQSRRRANKAQTPSPAANATTPRPVPATERAMAAPKGDPKYSVGLPVGEFTPEPMGHSTEPSRLQINGVLVSVPPEIPPWTSYEQACDELERRGFNNTRIHTTFDPQQLCDEVAELIRGRTGSHEMEVVNLTDLIPIGPTGNHSIFSTAANDVHVKSLKNPNKVYVTMRTKDNTPAFLGGVFYGFCANTGALAQATEMVQKRSTPCGMIIYEGRHLSLPFTALQGTRAIVARVIVSMVLRDDEFRCVVCEAPLVHASAQGDVGLERFIAAKCGHVCHPFCVLDRIKESKHGCPVCDGPLPWQWGVALRDEATQSRAREAEMEKMTAALEKATTLS
jgi:hypothetical protein